MERIWDETDISPGRNRKKADYALEIPFLSKKWEETEK